jgi:hypothetical protein
VTSPKAQTENHRKLNAVFFWGYFVPHRQGVKIKTARSESSKNSVGAGEQVRNVANKAARQVLIKQQLHKATRRPTRAAYSKTN